MFKKPVGVDFLGCAVLPQPSDRRQSCPRTALFSCSSDVVASATWPQPTDLLQIWFLTPLISLQAPIIPKRFGAPFFRVST